jgi:hypothetical protein
MSLSALAAMTTILRSEATNSLTRNDSIGQERLTNPPPQSRIQGDTWRRNRAAVTGAEAALFLSLTSGGPTQRI